MIEEAERIMKKTYRRKNAKCTEALWMDTKVKQGIKERRALNRTTRNENDQNLKVCYKTQYENGKEKVK